MKQAQEAAATANVLPCCASALLGCTVCFRPPVVKEINIGIVCYRHQSCWHAGRQHDPVHL